MDTHRMRRAGRALVIVAAVAAIVAAAEHQMTGLAASDTAGIPWRVVIAPAGEPGQPLVVTGTVYRPDGVTPAPGVVLEVHQTDAEGYYSKEKSGNDNPRLKGRVRTSPEGKYELRTIKPGSYPGTRNPAHIHAKVLVPGLSEAWIDEFWFEGDPFIASAAAAKQASKGKFSAIMRCASGDDGVLRCARDIRLER